MSLVFSALVNSQAQEWRDLVKWVIIIPMLCDHISNCPVADVNSLLLAVLLLKSKYQGFLFLSSRELTSITLCSVQKNSDIILILHFIELMHVALISDYFSQLMVKELENYLQSILIQLLSNNSKGHELVTTFLQLLTSHKGIFIKLVILDFITHKVKFSDIIDVILLVNSCYLFFRTLYHNFDVTSVTSQIFTQGHPEWQWYIAATHIITLILEVKINVT